MIVKYTPWEKRNLDVPSSVELIIDNLDKWKGIEDEVAKRQETYQVMHVPGGNTDVLLGAQDLGFKLIEMNLQLTRFLDFVQMPKIYTRFEPHISYHEADEKETDEILHYIKEGRLFTTDKIARDINFGVDKSGWRYYCWTKDVLKNGAKILCMEYKGKPIGFDVFVKQSNTIAEAFLGGLNPDNRNSGLGFIMVYLTENHGK